MKHMSILVVMMVVLVVGACSDDTTQDTPADTAEASATIVQPTEETSAVETTVGVNAVQIAQDVLAAFPDYDALLDYFAEDGSFGGHPIRDDSVQQNVRFFMALGEDEVVDECEAGPSEGQVTCRAVGRNDLSGPVGAVLDADWVFQITDGEVASCVFDVRDRSMINFVGSMADWVEREYPDVFEATFAAPEPCSPMEENNCWRRKWYASPEAAAVLLDLGPEYIAQCRLRSCIGRES